MEKLIAFILKNLLRVVIRPIGRTRKHVRHWYLIHTQDGWLWSIDQYRKDYPYI